METIDIPRHLWYLPSGGERAVLPQDALLSFPKPIVILGEPGIGKTQLTEWLERQGFVRFSARTFLNSPISDLPEVAIRPTVIDALDEVPAKSDGDVVDRLLRKLRDRGVTDFILTCRVLDWQSAISRQAIKDLYSSTDVSHSGCEVRRWTPSEHEIVMRFFGS